MISEFAFAKWYANSDIVLVTFDFWFLAMLNLVSAKKNVIVSKARRGNERVKIKT